MSLTGKIKSRTWAIQSWIMLNFGRATGNQHLESKGAVGRPEKTLRRRSGQIRDMFRR
ncbi:hypothetical protein [Nonomuraea longispora]|uniref:hypothetical protein n=1 Tax=Nonomuraea longispora TaxID=1848320 RepID=UPI001404B394|nr:hypothetical protein [Nonomuraea longispora]